MNTKWLWMVLCFLIIIGTVSGTSLNFQNPGQNTSVRNITYNGGGPSSICGVTIKWVRGNAASNYNNYVGYNSIRCAGGCTADTGGSQGGIVLNNPVYMSYAAATYRGFEGACYSDLTSRSIQLYGATGNLLYDACDWNSCDLNATPAAGDRIEVKISGAKIYIFKNGLPIAQPGGSLAANPAYIGFGSDGWTWPGDTANFQLWDDMVWGDTENKYVFGLPETTDDMIILGKDLVNPSSSGMMYGSNKTVINSNTMYGTWARGNASITPGAQPNETIQLLNYLNQNIVVEEKYTGTSAYAGTIGWNLTKIFSNASIPNGYYAMTIPGSGSYSNIMLYQSNGADVTWSADTYSRGDTGTVIYYVLDGGYWDTSTYDYKVSILDVWGNFKQNSTITASSGDVYYDWSTSDDPGVYVAWLIATDSSGREYVLGSDYTELVSYFGYNGYVNNGVTLQPIPSAYINITQDTITQNVSSGSDGNYSTTPVYLTGEPTTLNCNASGYLGYTYTFTPMVSKQIDLNITLLPNPMPFVGLDVGGIARDSVYGRPISGATITVRNTTTGEYRLATTNMAGFYNTTVIFEQPYNIWGSKTGYTNSTTYTKSVVGS